MLASLALEQSYDIVCASEIILKDIGKITDMLHAAAKRGPCV